MSPKNVFWQALLSAILIFGIGMLLGIYFENYRAGKVNNLVFSSEIDLLDSQMVGEVNDIFNISCEIRRQQMILFADRIYEEAALLEEYDRGSQLTDTLQAIHKKYDLLRLILWNEVVSYNSQCRDEIKFLVYIYEYDEPDAKTESEQITFGRIVGDLKREHGNKFILIPIAGDLDITSLEIVKADFDISKLPAVIINNRVVVEDVRDLGKLEDMLFDNDAEI